MAKKKMSPLLPVLGLGAIAALVLSSKKAGAAGSVQPEQLPTLPASPAPAGAGGKTVTVGKHQWKLVPTGGGQVDVFAPAGSWGPHGELRVLRYQEAGKAKVLVGAAEGVPKAVMDAAIKDLKIQMPAGPTVMTPPGRAPMPQALQSEMTALGLEMGVDSSGKVRGPVTAKAVQHATDLASRLEKAGYPEASATVRGWATAGAKMVPLPATPAVVPPGVPAELAAVIHRALQLERDPKRLEALLAQVRMLPASAERDMLIGALEALILQVKTAQAVSTAAVDIDEMSKPPGTRLLKLASPYMKGSDVTSWQNVLRMDYPTIEPDGVYGPQTATATKAWQLARGLKGDGIVGPATLAKVGTRPGVSAPPPQAASRAPQVAPSGPRLLKLTSPYMKGTDVQGWQNVLRSAGYSGVTPDGVFGPATSTATKDWQSKRGLKPDGIVGPATLAKVGSPPVAPVSVPASPSPRPDPKPKSGVETSAEAMVTHLLALQKKYGVKGSKGKQDLTLVKRFQSAVGGVADGLPGVNTMLAAARAGQGILPKVMYWKKGATKADVDAYKRQLVQISTAASSAGLSKLAAQLVASAATEDGSGI